MEFSIPPAPPLEMRPKGLRNKIARKVHEIKEIFAKYPRSLPHNAVEQVLTLLSDISALTEALLAAHQKDMDAAAKDIDEFNTTAQERIGELKRDIERAMRTIERLKSPPLGRATFIRYLREVGEGDDALPLVEVKDVNGRYARVFFMAEGVDPKTLPYGRQVVILGVGGANHVIEVLDEVALSGAEYAVKELLASDNEGLQVLVGGEHGDASAVVHCAHSVETSALERGSRVLVDGASGLIVAILPQREEDRFLVGEIPTVTFEDIGGHDNLVALIKRELAYPILYPAPFETLGLPLPKGFTMHGPPGVGKTMAAKAIVNYMNWLLKEQGKAAQGHFIHIRGPELESKWVGETGRMMREIFDHAKKIASPTSPVIIFFDEAEAMFPVRGSGISSDVGDKYVTQFASLMDGLAERGNIVVILATNRFDLIDRAVTRPGRCDRIITVPRPDKKGARAIFLKYLKAKHIHPKYLAQPIYEPKDRDGNPRVNPETGEALQYKFNGDPEKALAYLADRVIDRMFDAHRKANQFLRVKFFGAKKPVTLTYGDFVSGAMIANIIERAKKEVIWRHIDEGKGDAPFGVELIDLLRAVEASFAELRSPPTIGAFENWLQVEGIGAGKGVEGFTFISGNDIVNEE